MPAIKFVIDSTADLDQDWIRQNDISIVPLRVIFSEEELRDHFDIGPQEFYARMKSDPVAPRTSQPTPAEFEAAFASATEDGSTVICTTLSAALSGTWNSAMAARNALPDRDIRIIDTKTVSIAHLTLVHAAVDAARSGASADQIVNTVESLMAAQRLVFAVETLEYLRRGGRIGGAQAMLGSLLNIKPVLKVEDGKVDALDKVRTFGKAVDRLLLELEKSSQEWNCSPDAIVGHCENPEAAHSLAERTEAITGKTVPVTYVGPVIGCHGGPGAIGFSFHKPLPA
jgi:fatty acid kinase fatty acid binding subunit